MDTQKRSRQVCLVSKNYILWTHRAAWAREEELGVRGFRYSPNKALLSVYYKLGFVLDPEKTILKGQEIKWKWTLGNSNIQKIA